MLREPVPGVAELIQNPAEKEIESQDLLKTLNPENILDADGVERTILTFQNVDGVPVKVLFHGREDLPNLPDSENAFSFGSGALYRSEVDKMRYKEQIVKQHGRRINPEIIDQRLLQQGNSLFMVEQSPRALLDMAITLGVDSKKIREMRKLAFERKSSDELESLIDGVIAGNTVDDTGTLKDKPDNGGEALTLLALQGNTDASRIIEKRKSAVAEKTKTLADEQMSKLREYAEKHLGKSEALKLDELVGVHMTRYMPRHDKDGKEWQIQTSYDATKGRNPRITQHFTLNHAVVSSGMYGNWEGTPIAVITPLKKMIEHNGKPANLNTVDTFWEVSPGRRTTLPEGDTTVVYPSDHLQPGELSRKEGNEIIYKNGNFAPEDVFELIQKIPERGRYRFNQNIYRAFISGTSEYDYGDGHKPTIPLQDFHRLARVLGATEEDLNGVSVFGDPSGLSKEPPTELMNSTPRQFVDNIFQKAGVQVGEETLQRIVQKIEAELTMRNKYDTINKCIEDQGFEVHRAGMWAWDGDSWAATEGANKLGAEIGVNVMAHSHHESYEGESTIARYFGQIDETSSPTANKHAKKRFVENFFEKASPQFRRMMYEVGLI